MDEKQRQEELYKALVVEFEKINHQENKPNHHLDTPAPYNPPLPKNKQSPTNMMR